MLPHAQSRPHVAQPLAAASHKIDNATSLTDCVSKPCHDGTDRGDSDDSSSPLLNVGQISFGPDGNCAAGFCDPGIIPWQAHIYCIPGSQFQLNTKEGTARCSPTSLAQMSKLSVSYVKTRIADGCCAARYVCTCDSPDMRCSLLPEGGSCDSVSQPDCGSTLPSFPARVDIDRC